MSSATKSCLEFNVCWLVEKIRDFFAGNFMSQMCHESALKKKSRTKYWNKICGNKMPTRCNRGFYCRSYCLLNMFRAPLCPSSGAQEYYTVVFRAVVFKLRFAGCCSILQTAYITLSSTPDQQLENHSTKYPRQQPLYNTLELLMMGIVVPETCWASNKICNKNLCCI